MRGGRMFGCSMALLAMACSAQPTQLVVLVDTDYRVPDELAFVRARVLDGDEAEISANTFAVTAEGMAEPPSRFAIPLSFGVVPVGGDVSRRVAVEVMGLSPDETTLVTRRARTGFVDRQRLLLPMFLLRRCENVSCPDGQTCTEMGCVDDMTDPMDLDPIEPGDELDGSVSTDAGEERDAGPEVGPDGGADAGPVEAGVMDAGPADAGQGDAGPPSFGPPSRIASVVCSDGTATLSVSAPVPEGATVVVTVVYRGIAWDTSTVSDSNGEIHAQLPTPPSLSPSINVHVHRLVAGLAPGDSITVTHPAGRAVAVTADWLRDADPALATLTTSSALGTMPSASLSTMGPGILYAVQANNNTSALVPPTGWTPLPDIVTACGAAAPGRMGVRTLHRSVSPGMHTFAGTLTISQNWSVLLLAFQ